MGVVYRARDMKLGRTVALKFLPPQWSHDEGAKQRFRREAQAASATNHPSICVIHDIQETDDGQLFIVMAYYEGQTLKQKLEQGPLPVPEALEIAAGVAEGLAKAHAQGVVHRDVKPGNLIVTEDGVKILDFGLAKFADALQLTQPGSTLGTVAYMAPEQARGEEADERSDVWALGVVLYEMLAGEVPFKGAYAEAIFYAIKNETPPPLQTPGRDIPEALDRIVMRALAKNQSERYQTARELARELRFLQGRSLPLDLRTEPIDSRSAQRQASLKKTRRTRAAAVLGIVLVALGSTYAWLARPLPRMSIAVVPVANHTGESSLDGHRLALTQSLIAELEDSPNLRVSPYSRELEILRQYLGGSVDPSSQEAIQTLTNNTGSSVLIVPELKRVSGAWQAHADIRNAATGTNDASIDTEPIRSALPEETVQRLIPMLAAMVQDHFKPRWPHRVPARSAESRFRNLNAARAFEAGTNSYEQLEYAAALLAFRRGVDADPQRALGHAWVSRTSLLMGDGDGAVAAARAAAKLLSPFTSQREVRFVAAVLAEAEKDLSTAEQRYRDLAALRPDEAQGQLELADFLKRQALNEPAVNGYFAALKLDPGLLRAHVDLCQLYSLLDDYPSSDQHAQAALNGFSALGNRGGEAQALLCSGELQRRQGGSRLPEARKTIERARTIFESLGYQYGLARAYQYLGIAAGDAGDWQAAVTFFEQALNRSRQNGNRQIEALELMNLGVASDALGERRRALDFYQQARDLYTRIGDERRAAEQQVNTSNLIIISGPKADHADALRRLESAQATLRKLGGVEFDVFATQVAAVNTLYSGHPTDAMRELQVALSRATERHLTSKVVTIGAKLGEAAFLAGNYETARSAFERALESEGGAAGVTPRIGLARVYGRYADFPTARTHLDRALSLIQSRHQLALAPSAYMAAGELAYESGDLRASRDWFEKSASMWTDDLPDAGSVEAKCYQGLVAYLEGKANNGRTLLQASVAQAVKMGRLYLEARCRTHLARLEIGDRHPTTALAVLNQIPRADDGAFGPELSAEIHRWRAVALEATKASGASAEHAAADALLTKIRADVPETYRDRFGARADIRVISR
jgi:serine/threonine protein kinase